jgi:hypothetical protein
MRSALGLTCCCLSLLGGLGSGRLLPVPAVQLCELLLELLQLVGILAALLKLLDLLLKLGDGL